MPDCLFFDFDGTLVDSSPGIYRAFSTACSEVGLMCPPLSCFRTNIGPPIQVMVKYLFPDIDNISLTEFLSVFRREYDGYDHLDVVWHDGVVEGLADLYNYYPGAIYVVTNKPTLPTASIVKSAGLSAFFNSIVGIDYRKLLLGESLFVDKADAIHFTLGLATCKPEQVIYIGDTPADRESSSKCGVSFIAATYGFYRWHQNEFAAAPSASCFMDVVELINRFKRK